MASTSQHALKSHPYLLEFFIWVPLAPIVITANFETTESAEAPSV
jgi:hypothetical protein